jgi:hypothetical protein
MPRTLATPLAMSILCAAALSACGEAPARDPDAINAVVGDRSWGALRGDQEPESDTERIRVHLEWVERALRLAQPAGMDARALARRADLLDELAAYRDAGRFPQREDDRPGFHPRFIDSEGRLCAVGHLIAASTSREVAEELNDRHEYAYVLEMDDPAVDGWAAAHGFTVYELAMIQPSYPPSHARDLLWGVGVGKATYATGLSYRHNLYSSSRYSEMHDPEALAECRERTGHICLPGPVYPPTGGLQLQATLGWDVWGGRPAADLDLLYAMPGWLETGLLGASTFAWSLGLGLGSALDLDAGAVALAPTGIVGVEWFMGRTFERGFAPLSLVAEWRPFVRPEDGWSPQWLSGGVSLRYSFGRYL